MPEFGHPTSAPSTNGGGSAPPVGPGEFLRAHPPFHRLSDESLRRAENAVEIAYAPRGDLILDRSAPANTWLYMVRKGSVRLEADGRVVALLEEGECFGFPSLLAESSPTVDVVADEDCLLYRIPQPAFQRLMAEPEFASFFVEGLHERLRRAVHSTEPNLIAADLSSPCRVLVSRPPVEVGPDATVADAARVMSAHNTSSVLVTTEPMGILTDRDLRNRVLARGLSPDTPVLRAFTRPVTTLPVDAPLFEMLLLMLEHRVHHVPLMEHDEVIAVVTDTDLLRHHLKSPFHLLKSVERSEDPRELAGYSQRLSGIIESMVASGLDAGQIGRVVATLNDAVVVRLLRAAEADLGPPPCRYAWIVFGSEGRREQAMLTDQDNAIIYADDTADAATYFSSVADRVVRGLTETGFPRCAGGFMATNWCRPLAAWVDLFQSWIREPRPEALLEAANFFDFRSVHGGLSLSPLEEVVAGAHSNRVFLAHLVKAALRFRPPLGLFRTIKEEDGGVDVKKGGIMPIVSMARTYGLEAASRARGTLERLEAARAAEILSDEGAEVLSESFRYLFRLRLDHQLVTRRHGGHPSNRIMIDDLTPMEKRHLKDAFRHVHGMQEALSHRWRVDALG